MRLADCVSGVGAISITDVVGVDFIVFIVSWWCGIHGAKVHCWSVCHHPGWHAVQRCWDVGTCLGGVGWHLCRHLFLDVHDVGTQKVALGALQWLGEVITVHFARGMTFHMELSAINQVFHEKTLDVDVTGALVAALVAVLMELHGALVVLQHFDARAVSL